MDPRSSRAKQIAIQNIQQIDTESAVLFDNTINVNGDATNI
jgi:hypothetical protein